MLPILSELKKSDNDHVKYRLKREFLNITLLCIVGFVVRKGIYFLFVFTHFVKICVTIEKLDTFLRMLLMILWRLLRFSFW